MPAPKVKVSLVWADRQIRPISCQLEMGTLMPQVNGLGGNSDQEFQRWYKPPHLSVESIQNLKSKILQPPHLSRASQFFNLKSKI
ncbi:hypothetical protein [Microcoleus sp. T2B6]|uniref:hypothetical protein n=1 Tax=Microcoleus sp. T2B6 TaxID=3055424 RepID=UPI002FD0F057